ncbi:NERD domain-containing protein [Candidatus Solincola sp.]|nr:NERD domain-containing protein/DEAD/DEAH box helicase [Actinomycetota bacterium]MDI7253113.1 NERD domain-containing protein/DEAD/DEAH box helicase [Actinomycetota bacterium]
MIPQTRVEGVPRGELRFYQYLRDGLPDEYTVFHSLPYLSAGERGIFEHEIDFLVVHRKKGLLTIEVKGGEEVIYRPRERKWFSVPASGDRRHEIKDPFDQARSNMHWLKEEILKRGVFPGADDLPCAYGYAVAFPDAAVQAKHFPPHALPELVIDREGLDEVGERVEGIMDRMRRPGSRALTEREYNDLYNRFLLPEFRLTTSIARRLEDEEAEILRLTEEQCRVLDVLRNQRRALIQGYAGTGKTQLAVEKARRLAAEGLSVLILCFNRPLAAYLRKQIRPEEGRIDVYNYHDLCIRLAERAGLPCQVPGEEDRERRQRFWAQEVPRLLGRALDLLDLRYDAVVVDEGQDFRREWSESVLKLLRDREESHLYIFFDERQNLYHGEEPQFPVRGDPFLLTENCRNTRRICEAACRIGEIDEEDYRFDRNPEGEEVRYLPYREPKEQPGIIEDVVSRLLKKGIRPGQITILSPHVRERSCLSGVEELAGCRLVDFEDPGLSSNDLVFCTLKRFKGLESDVVIFCDMDGRFPVHDRKDQYVAVTRAKHLLYVVHDRRWNPPAGQRR